MKIYEPSDFEWSLHAIDSYRPPENPSRWAPCPVCHARPRVWEFDNGRYARCLCSSGPYEGADVSAEPIVAYYKRCKTTAGFDDDALLKAWNLHVRNSPGGNSHQRRLCLRRRERDLQLPRHVRTSDRQMK